MATLTSSSTLAQIRAEHVDNASYVGQSYRDAGRS